MFHSHHQYQQYLERTARTSLLSALMAGSACLRQLHEPLVGKKSDQVMQRSKTKNACFRYSFLGLKKVLKDNSYECGF
jgi:hypothetical protein